MHREMNFSLFTWPIVKKGVSLRRCYGLMVSIMTNQKGK